MPATDRFVKIGRVLKANGTDGELVIGLYGINPDDVNENEPVFIFFDGLPVPFFLSGMSLRGSSKLLAHLTDVISLEDAEEFLERDIFLPEDSFEDDAGGLPEVIGWTVEGVGEIVDIEDIPGNPCLVVCRDGGEEILIPFNEDLVSDVDEDSRILRMNIPEGLLQ